MRRKSIVVLAALVGFTVLPALTQGVLAGPELTPRSTIAVAAGVTTTSYIDSAPRNVIYVTEVLPGAPIAIKAVAASPTGQGGTALLTTLCQAVNGRACINGDFFNARGPLGGELVDGHWLKAADRTQQQVWVTGAGQFSLGAMPAGAVQSLGATNYAILLPGRPIAIPEHDAFADRAYARTLVGWNGAGDRFFVTVEQGTGSAGMSLAQAAGLMQQLGATTAVNEDGGGSSQMVVNGVRYAAPGEWARPLANAWAIVAVTPTAPASAPARAKGATARPSAPASAPSDSYSPSARLQATP